MKHPLAGANLRVRLMIRSALEQCGGAIPEKMRLDDESLIKEIAAEVSSLMSPGMRTESRNVINMYSSSGGR